MCVYKNILANKESDLPQIVVVDFKSVSGTFNHITELVQSVYLALFPKYPYQLDIFDNYGKLCLNFFLGQPSDRSADLKS